MTLNVTEHWVLSTFVEIYIHKQINFMRSEILIRNNVTVFGKGEQVIMFAYGFGCTQNMWRLVTPAFEEHYKIVLFDYVGCGESDHNAYNSGQYSSLDGYAQDILDVCTELKLENVIFIGHSISCMIGLLAAVDQPNLFSSMIFIGPSPRYMNDVGYVGGFSKEDMEGLLEMMHNNFMGWANFLAPAIVRNDERPELAREVEASFCSTDPIITRKFAQVTFFSDNRDNLSKLALPCLILQSSDDAIAPETVGRYTHQMIKDSIFVKMDATGHCPHLTHPDETIAHIQKFLNQKV